nr:MAG TPA: hypothetical protein [Caudoviricetes sp.]
MPVFMPHSCRGILKQDSSAASFHCLQAGFTSYFVVLVAEELPPSFSLMASESLLRRMPPTEAALTPSAENLPFS